MEMLMYNMIFGENTACDFILATLGLTRADTGRFRDCFVANGEIAVYTRNGGGNREQYQKIIDDLAQNLYYLRDEDDAFDCTYATIYFKFPEEYADELKKLDIGIPFDPSAHWLDAIEALKKLK
jgi:hypothetical protein